jgi:hypothetical protein
MKTVFTSQQVFHVWAAQSQYEGRGGNVSFREKALYSYRAMIARFAETVTGERVALITSRKYSVTTSGHCSAARQALRHVRVFVVPHVDPLGSDSDANLAHLVAEYRGEVSRAMRARKLPYYITQDEGGDIELSADNYLSRLARDCSEYAQAFGLPDPALDWQADSLRIFEKWRGSQTPEAIARREKAKAKRAVADRAKAEKQAQERAGRIEAWRNGGAPLWRADLDAMPCALLRVVGDTLQTSHGASVPLRDAKRLFALISQDMRSHVRRAWEHGFRVGNYTLSHISENGDFRVGCHTIEYKEAARLAAEIGFNPMQEAPQGWGVIEA